MTRSFSMSTFLLGLWLLFAPSRVVSFAAFSGTTTSILRNGPQPQLASTIAHFSFRNQEPDWPDHKDAGSARDSSALTKSSTRRRLFWSSSTAFLVGIGWRPLPVHAVEETDNNTPTVLLQGTVTLAPGTPLSTTDNENAALYITCRPDRPDQVPQAILNGTNGKPPPVLATRVSVRDLSSSTKDNDTWAFRLTSRDVTPEGLVNTNPGDSSNDANSNNNTYWWTNQPLVVSARWDTDGVAATRSPDDLVGQTKTTSSPEAISVAQLELTGRGAFGKWATTKSK